MVKKIFICFLMVLCMAGCVNRTEESWNMHASYEQVSEENVFYEGNKESLDRLMEHGIGIIFLGFPECPWCQAYAPLLNEAVREWNTTVMYYNIYLDKTADREFYDKTAERLFVEDDLQNYDNEGRPVIYMPLVIFVNQGEIIFFDHETCMENTETITPEDYWTDEKKAALVERLSAAAHEIAVLQYENESQGCSMECGN